MSAVELPSVSSQADQILGRGAPSPIEQTLRQAVPARHLTWFAVLLLLLAALLLSMVLLPTATLTPVVYLLLHSAMHTGSMIVGCLVFALAWHIKPVTVRQTVIACTFLSAAVLGFFNVYSTVGQYTIFAHTQQAALWFWVIAQACIAAGLLSAVLIPRDWDLNAAARWPILMGTLCVVALVPLSQWAGWAAQINVFETDGQFGSVLVRIEGVLFILLCAAMIAAIFRRTRDTVCPHLAAACAVAAGGTLFFLLRQPYGGIAYIVGQAFQVMAGYLMYRSLFMAAVNTPYAHMDALRAGALEAEARWSQALEAAGHGVFDWNLKTGHIFRSKTYCEILGYDGAELKNMSPILEELMVPEDRAHAHAALAQLLEGEVGQYYETQRVRLADGHQKWLSVRATVMHCGPNGMPTRVMGTITDVSQRMQLQRQITQVTKALRALMAREHQQLEVERKRIAQALHDDLGQHLVALRMENTRLSDRLGKPAEQGESIVRMNQLIDGAREAVRRALSNLRPAALDELGLAVAVRRLVEEWGRQHQQKTEVVTSGPWDDVPSACQADLYQIVVEALNNVAQHARSHSVHVALLRHPRLVQLTIADDGQGLAPDAQSKQGHYGLFGISERVARQGGTMSLQSALGLGTELAVSIPLSEPPRQTTPSATEY